MEYKLEEVERDYIEFRKEMEEDEQRKSKKQDRKNPGNLKTLNEWMNTKIMTTFHFNSTGLLNNS